MSNLAHLGGWIDDPKAVEQSMSQLPFPVFSDLWSATKESGKGKKMLLYDIIRKVAGHFPNRHQADSDCVSQGTALAVDIAKCVDIFLKGDFERWVAETSTEDIYSGGRNIIGKSKLGNKPGCIGSWAAQYVNEYGGLPRDKYGNIDLTKYDGNKAREWGRSGFTLPKEFLDIAKKHPILVVSQVNSWDEVRDLIYNGYGVTIASSQGFSSVRDKDGFAKPEGTWQHQMCLAGMDDESPRPGALCCNSWGSWNSGPKRYDQPDGSFWIDADELEDRILKTGDCWAYSGYEGFQPNKLKTRII